MPERFICPRSPFPSGENFVPIVDTHAGLNMLQGNHIGLGVVQAKRCIRQGNMRKTIALERPKLRPIEIRPHPQDGQTYFLLRDPLQLADGSLLLPQPLAAALTLFDGSRTVEEIAADFRLHFGIPIEAQLVERLAEAADEACLFENERSEAVRREKTEAYRGEPYRPARLAGMGYPQDPAQLYGLLESYLAAFPPVTDRPELVSAVSAGKFGLLSPHIDYPRGGPVYAQVWQQAAAAIRAADLVILFGTDHSGDDPFTLTRQSYATPYGVLPTAQPVVDAVVDVIGEGAAFAGELRHRGEHSLELVAVWLHHMRCGVPVEMTPILVGSLHDHIMNGSSPDGDSQINRVLDALSAATRGRRVAVIASGDMSHAGAAFGGDPLNEAARTTVRLDDEELIAHMRQGSADGFFGAIRSMRDRNNVCGVSPIYLTLRLLGDVRGELHGYASCPADAENASAVTVCGMIFH